MLPGIGGRVAPLGESVNVTSRLFMVVALQAVVASFDSFSRSRAILTSLNTTLLSTPTGTENP